nr:glycosyltransferase family 4 protein [uncultured Desulfobacter sp.]
MKIIVLSKRQYTNLDLINDKFGRIRELPMALAKLGHEINGLCLSYRSRPEGIHSDVDAKASVTWHCLNFKRLVSFGDKSYRNKLNAIFREQRPDLIWGSSDALHIILGACIARFYNIPFVADLYDNYESFSTTRLLGGKRLFRYALMQADGITCVSGPLARYIRKTTSFNGPVKVLENAISKDIFYPMDKLDCRRQLNLPNQGFYIGTAGAISESRGIQVLFDAFEQLARQNPDIRLLLAGPCDKKLILPHNDRIHYLGTLPPNQIPIFLSAIDLQVICNKDSAFGRYCFPQKFYEAVACKVPLVASAVGAMRETLKSNPDHLFEPENAISLEAALKRKIQNPSPLPLEAATWDMRGRKLEQFIIDVVSVYNM